MCGGGGGPPGFGEEKRYERLNRIPQHRHRPCCGRRRWPSRPLLMAETAVWVPYESPAHVRATASSTVDVDLMVSVDGTGFASANLQDHASHALWTPAWTGIARMLARGTQWVVLSAASAQESDAESNAGPSLRTAS